MGIIKNVRSTSKGLLSHPSASERNASNAVQGQYNILVLGETQAGKSTLIQAIHQYADPNHKTKEEVIGTGLTSCTNDVIQYSILTDLPSFEVFDTTRPDSSEPSATVEYEKMGIEDYEDALNVRMPPRGKYGIRRAETSKPRPEVLFHLIDTPGLNDTEGNDEVHMANIFDALKEAGDIHLVLLVVGQSMFGQGLKDALLCYLEAFPQLQEILSIVHTKTDYTRTHPDDTTGFGAHCATKIKHLSDLIGRSTFPHFWIDCDLASVKSIRKCMTLNLIQKILKIATYNQPISFRSAMMKKTPKMRAIDELVEDRYGDLSKCLIDTVGLQDEVKGKLMEKMLQMRDAIAKNESVQDNCRAFIKDNETDEVELMDEDRTEDSWGYFRIIHPVDVALKEQPFRIDLLNVVSQGLRLKNEKGGQGSYFWSAQYKRMSYKDALLHIRTYVKKNNKYRQEIEDTKIRLIRLVDAHEILEEERRMQADYSEEFQMEVDRLLEKYSLYDQMVKIIREHQMRPDLFRALAEAGAYRGTPAESIQKVVEVFTEFLAIPDIDGPSRSKIENVAQDVEDLMVSAPSADEKASCLPDDNEVEEVHEANEVIDNYQKSEILVPNSLMNMGKGINTTEVPWIDANDAVDDDGELFF